MQQNGFRIHGLFLSLNVRSLCLHDTPWRKNSQKVCILHAVAVHLSRMEPLASKIRPKTLEEFVGQEHLVGTKKPIRFAIERKHLFLFILWGPPGVGKTTLAKIYTNALDAELYELSAVSAGKDDVKRVVGAQSWGKPKNA